MAPVCTNARTEASMQTTRSTAATALSESDIQAYVDGLLAPERAAEIRRYLSERPDEARRVAFYGNLNRQMQAGFQDADSEDRAPLSCLRLYGALVAGALRWRARVFAVVLLLALSAAGGLVWAMHVPGEALEAAAVMALQRAGATQTVPTSDPDGKSFADAPDLSSVGLRTVGRISARISPFARAKGFVYRSANGLPAVLLSVPDLSATAQPQWQARRLGVSRVLSWTAGRTRFVLAGRADTRGLMRAADLMTAR